ncbi:MAG: tetratricopeptide repeat protein [Roseiarcus sp.]
MPYGIVIAVLDIALIVHAAKTGRFMPWGFVILFLPGIGALAYVVVELLPEWLGSHKARRARQQFAGAIDPTRRYRQLHDDLEIVDTIANRTALAEECLTLGKYDEALGQYDAILAKPLGEEPGFMLGKARAEYGLGDAGAAIATLDELKRRWPAYQSADGRLLYATALEMAGRNDEALANYADVGRYYPGAEPRVRQAQLLQRLGRQSEARAIAEDVVRTLTRAPAHVRKSQRQWLTSAQKLARS